MILITGGAGYIGSHTCLTLIENGHDVIILDNFSNSSMNSIKNVEIILNTSIKVIQGDIRKTSDLQNIFDTYEISSVIHFAGLKAVGESVEQPLNYYDVNIHGTMVLLDVMKKNNCKSIIFSSSATVYGNPHTVPIKEDFPLSPTNPYGRSKYFVEEILNDLYYSDKDWKIILLRYFNPVGAHVSGRIGEDPNGKPNNLMPFIAQVAIGKRDKLSIFGNDYNTPDGTGVRDYIHVIDLAQGHLKAVEKIHTFNTVMTINLGTGIGYSVLDMIKTFEKASSTSIPYTIVNRRSGDIASCYTDPSYAKEVLGWEAKKTIQQMCEDSWRWQVKNPNGYQGS